MAVVVLLIVVVVLMAIVYTVYSIFFVKYVYILCNKMDPQGYIQYNHIKGLIKCYNV